MRNSAYFSLACVLVVIGFVVSPSTATATDLFVDCTGSTPGAFSKLQDAIDSLDLVGPNTIYVLNGPCNESIWIIDRQRLTITAEGIGVFIDGTGFSGPVMYIAGSTGIRLVQIGFINGNFGLMIDRASEVSVEGCTIGAGNNGGVIVYSNSTLSLNGLVTGNARNGITVVDSQISLDSAVVENNGRYGLVMRKSHGVISNTVFQGNSAGLGVNASAVEVYGPITIQANTTGMNVLNAGSAALYGDQDNPITITGNSWTGINTDGAFLTLSSGTRITNNGFGGQPLHAGLRVDDNTTLVVSGAEITGNSGPGIDAINAGAIGLGASVVSNNAGDGVRLAGNSSIFVFSPNDNLLSGNLGLAINCDDSSVFSGDRTGIAPLACKYSPMNDRVPRHLKQAIVPDDEEKPPKPAIRRK